MDWITLKLTNKLFIFYYFPTTQIERNMAALF